MDAFLCCAHIRWEHYEIWFTSCVLGKLRLQAMLFSSESLNPVNSLTKPLSLVNELFSRHASYLRLWRVKRKYAPFSNACVILPTGMLYRSRHRLHVRSWMFESDCMKKKCSLYWKSEEDGGAAIAGLAGDSETHPYVSFTINLAWNWWEIGLMLLLHLLCLFVFYIFHFLFFVI